MSMIAEMHKRDKDGIAVYISTELRGQLQVRDFPGIDQDRLLVIDSNDPVEIFDDLLDGNLKAKLQDGMPLRMIVLDSVTGILGIKRKNADTIEQHLIGDQALTIGNALANLVPWCKRNKVLLIGTAQMRANVDAGPYGEKTKMGASFAVKHAFEMFISVKRAGSSEDKQDIEGKTFEDEETKDARGNKLLNAHKVFTKMEANSIGPAGRAGVFTLSYDQGIVNQHEEIFWLGKNMGVIATPNNRTYTFGGESFNGKKECALAIRDNPEMAKAILEQVRKLDEKES
jgi:RecA/RadA recombinase